MPNDTSRPTMVLSLDVEAFYRVVEDGFYDVGGKRQQRYSMRPQGEGYPPRCLAYHP